MVLAATFVGCVIELVWYEGQPVYVKGKPAYTLQRNDKGKGKQMLPSGTPVPSHVSAAEMNAAQKSYEQ